MYADIVPLRFFGETDFLTYAVPVSLSELGAGDIAHIPLGKRQTQGVVLRLHENRPKFTAKEITEVVYPAAAGQSQLKLAKWLSQTYLSSLSASMRTIVPVKFGKKRRPGAAETAQAQTGWLTLSKAQEEALGQLKKSAVSLLHGATNSGKTELYLRLAAETLEGGRGVIILVPEISLTPQTLESFAERFPGDTVAWHSRLSEAERWRAWEELRTGSKRLVVGSRSALFAPIDKLGLIVIDEEHDLSYKQEQNPRYVTRDTALALAELTRAKLVLGSATPSLEAIELTKRGNMTRIDLPDRVQGALPRIQIVDLRNELKKGNLSPISESLQVEIGRSLTRKEQAILFLNRRGTSWAIVCRNCGEAIRCPHCEISLTHHAPDNLICHHCGFTRKTPKTCPNCDSHLIRYLGAGTEKLAAELGRLFPDARILRMDKDTTTKKGSHADLFEKFRSGAADILVGTQMITKGWDIPSVTTIGIALADLSLTVPDFRAGETTFQLLTQVAGRAGRGDHPGTVIIQTYSPDHPVIEAVQRHDFEGYLERELELRKALHYPPFTRLIKLTIEGTGDDSTLRHATELASTLRGKLGPEIEVLGPVAGILRKIRGKYLYHITLKYPPETDYHSLKELLPRDIAVDVDPVRLA